MMIGKSTSHPVLGEDKRSLQKKERVIVLIPREVTDHSSLMKFPSLRLQLIYYRVFRRTGCFEIEFLGVAVLIR